MPVTTRLQERLRAIEAAENASRSIRSPAPSPVPSSPVSSIRSSPPARLPMRIINPLIKIHSRRSLAHTLHHFQGDVTANLFPDFSHPEPIYIPGAGEEEPGTGFSNVACHAPDEELECPSNRKIFEAEWDDELPELPDYLSDEDQTYEYPSLPGASPAAPLSSFDTSDYTWPVDIGDDLRGIKRKRPDEEGLLTGVEKFLNELPIGTGLTLREMVEPRLRSPSLGRFTPAPAIPNAIPPRAIPDAVPHPAKKPKLIPLDDIPMHPRAKNVLTRLHASYLAQQEPQGTYFAPSLSPIVELPERKCRFYKVESNYNPAEPNWVPDWPVHEEWKGSLSPKISPTGNGTTLYSIGCNGRKRKLEEIKGNMSLERILNPEPARKKIALPGFRAVVMGIE